ncbi:hypothetical protein CSA37_02780 [Candidatus Fermentibacteria bacterium]|nr:MAG: hypothetical protein CSA37_02780 [Candidatus Fermentibacteria bacterium]
MRNRVLMLVVAGVLLLSGCGVTDVLNFLNAEFRIENTSEFRICGINISDLGSLTPFQIAEVVSVLAGGVCPMDFTMGLGIKNPNTGVSGLPKMSITLTSLDYDLFLDTIEGSEEDTVQVADGLFTGEFGIGDDGVVAVLDLGIEFDGIEVLGLLEPMDFISLALAIGGIDSNLRDEDHLGRLLMFGVPAIETPLGDMTWEEGFWIGLDWTDGS